jgi:hypothetical protein
MLLLVVLLLLVVVVLCEVVVVELCARRQHTSSEARGASPPIEERGMELLSAWGVDAHNLTKGKSDRCARSECHFSTFGCILVARSPFAS